MDHDYLRRAWPYALGLLACAFLGWFAFVRGVPVPLLGAADTGFHELGHLLFAWGPKWLTALAGSFVQVGVPLGLAAYFAFARKDTLGVALMLAWAGTAAQSVSVYVADAPYQQLELIGGQHDWAFLLANQYAFARPLASAVWVLGATLWMLGVTRCAGGLLPAHESLRG